MTSRKPPVEKVIEILGRGLWVLSETREPARIQTLLDLLDKEKKIIDSGKAEKAQKLKNNFNITLTDPIPKTERSN